MSIINIAIVDDNRLFLRGLSGLINQLPDYDLLFEAKSNIELAQKMSRRLKPKVFLIHINMLMRDDGFAIEILAQACPDAGIITYSMDANQDQVVHLTKKGVKGYLLKEADYEEFKNALQNVSLGGYYYPPFVTGHLVRQFDKDKQKGIKQDNLNKRELEFLKLSGSELTYKEIARQMCVSARTVDGYRDTLFEKLKVKSRVGLVLYAIKNNLVSV